MNSHRMSLKLLVVRLLHETKSNKSLQVVLKTSEKKFETEKDNGNGMQLIPSSRVHAKVSDRRTLDAAALQNYIQYMTWHA